MRFYRNWSLSLKISFSIIIFLGVACSIFLYWLKWNLFSTRFNDPELLATNADFSLPKSARNVNGHFTGLNNFTMYGKFDMDANEFKEFEKNTNCNSPFQPINSNSSYLSHSQYRWWNPSSESLICFGGSDGCGKTIIVDFVETETYTIFVHAGCG